MNEFSNMSVLEFKEYMKNKYYRQPITIKTTTMINGDINLFCESLAASELLRDNAIENLKKELKREFNISLKKC